jgi:hypothetical protein
MGQRWALYIDVEGFGVKWNDSTIDAFRGINALMQGIFRIGDRYYREPPDRLFAHQFGDGFLVVSDFHEPLLDRAILVGIALLRHLLANGETAKCTIAEGELSDIQNCYPREVRSQLQKWNIHFGAGVMTITPVLGSALINTVHLQKRSPSGPLLTLSEENSRRLSCGAIATPTGSSLAVVNWLRGEPSGLKPLQLAAGFKQHAEHERSAQLSAYIASNAFLKPEWKDNAQKYLLGNGV